MLQLLLVGCEYYQLCILSHLESGNHPPIYIYLLEMVYFLPGVILVEDDHGSFSHVVGIHGLHITLW